MQRINYSVVIRTLGNAGEKYQATLDSILSQTVKPDEIIVVIPEDYPLPLEETGTERFIRSKKGMVIQRAVGIEENKSEYILLLDDDVRLEPDFVKKMYLTLMETKSKVVIPIVKKQDGSLIMFEIDDINKRRFNFKKQRKRITSWLLGVRILKQESNDFCLRISRTGGYIVRCYLDKDKQYFAQTGSGAACFAVSESLINITLKEEIWLENSPYALSEDQVMYYKLYRLGYRIALNQSAEIIHLDAGAGKPRNEKQRNILFALERNGLVLWHRFIFSTDITLFEKLNSLMCILRRITSTLTIALIFKILKKNKYMFDVSLNAYSDAFNYIKSSDYKIIPKIKAVQKF